jgi:hypothetical protein
MGSDAVQSRRYLPAFGVTGRFYPQSTLKTESIDSSEMLATIYQIIRRHIPEEKSS